MKTFKIGQQSLLGYLPAIVIQNVLDDKIKESSKPPLSSTLTTVSLFADISGFTKLSEAFSVKGRTGSEFLAFCINRYMELLINIIGKNGGDIFKFAGDALLVIWPEEENEDYEKPCRRALQCALEIQSNLKAYEMSKGKTLSVKVGLGFGECKVLLVGGQFHRFEYLIVGEAMRQACTSECHCKGGGETVVSQSVFEQLSKYYEFDEAEPDTEHGPGDGLKYYKFKKSLTQVKIQIRADAFLMRTRFSVDKIRNRMGILKTFVPAAITRYLDIEKEVWSKESRLLTIMFLNLTIDLKHTKTESGLQYIQSIINTVQRCVYRTRGSLNKFLMDDKGSVLLVVWGIPPFSAYDDPLRAVQTGLNIINSLKEIQSKDYECCGAKMGITTGCCFSGVCGNIGGRREYSLLGEIVNLSARFMQQSMIICGIEKKKYQILICEKTKNLIQDKISCKWVTKGSCKGFSKEFDFYEPLEKEEIPDILFTMIKTHRFNATFDKYGKLPQNKIQESLFIVGREKEISNCLDELQTVITTNQSKCVIVSGIIGSGKSLFMRKVLVEFIESSPSLKSILPENNPKRYPFIFVTRQYPTLLTAPYNGCFQFLHDMYSIIGSNQTLTKKTVELDNGEKVRCDKIGELIVKNKYFAYLNYINEILSCDILKDHFEFGEQNRLAINANILSFEDPERDPYFSKRKLAKHLTKLHEFFCELVTIYRQDYIPETILILIIEDCHLVDSNTITLLNKIYLMPQIFIACTYQDTLNPYVIQEPPQLIYDNSFELKGLPSISDTIKVIKHFCQKAFKMTIYEIENITLTKILEHSCKNNPLIVQDIVEALIDQKLLEYVEDTHTLKSSKEFMKYCRTLDWSRFNIPFLIEKLVGNIIDSLNCTEIIILKHAAVIGTIFDIDKLNHLNIFNNITFEDLLQMIYNFSEKGLVEILYDINPKKLIAKFDIFFLKEILYKRMLVETKSEIHIKVARLMESSRFSYLNSNIEKELLNNHLMEEEKTILDHMDDSKNLDEANRNGETTIICKENNQKIQVLKELINKLREIDLRISPVEEYEDLDEKDKKEIVTSRNSMPIVKDDVIEKKSDKGISWESRFVIATKTRFYYWYTSEDYKKNHQYLGMFELKHLYHIKVLRDSEFSGKANILELKVSSYYKKDMLKKGRDYIFACKEKHELNSWVIILNFLRAKSIYDEFRFTFGIINFPLHHEKRPSEKKKKKRKFNLIHNNMRRSSTTSNNLLRNMSLTNRKSKEKKNSITGPIHSFLIEKREENETEKIDSIKQKTETLTSLTIMYFFGVIQSNLNQTNIEDNNNMFIIESPPHLVQFNESLQMKKVIKNIEDTKSKRHFNESNQIVIKNQKKPSISIKSDITSNENNSNDNENKYYTNQINTMEMEAKDKLQTLKIDLRDDILDEQIKMLIEQNDINL